MGDSLDEKVLEERYGILLRHVEQIKRYNKRLNWIIMLRPINKEVAGKLRSGGRGKIISIKGKSSEFTFLAGDILYEAGLSKLGKDGSNSDWSRIAHFNSINKQSIENSYGNKKAQDIKQQIEELKQLGSQELNEKQQELNEKQQELKQQIEELKQLGSQELQQTQQELNEKQQELNEKQQELNEKQQELKNKTLEYNLNFNLSKIKKIVEIDARKYESFYEIDGDEHPRYEEYDGKQQPVVYVREVGSSGSYSKIEYDDSEIGYSIDESQQKDSNDASIKPIEVFSYEQYEECAISGDKKIRIDNTTIDEFEVEGYYETNTESKQFYVRAKKEGDDEFKYYSLTEVGSLAGQDIIDTYKIDSTSANVNTDVEIVKLETTYELINPPLTADYDQLSAAQVYKDGEQIDGLTDLNSVVRYLKREQEKLISFPSNKYLEECKAAARRLKEQDFSQKEADTKLLSELLEKDSNDDITPQECDILQLKLGLLGVCGKSVTKNTVKLGSILDYGISHGLEILHFPPEPIKLKHIDGTLDEEFLVIDGEGNPRVARNLEGVLFFMNNQRNSGVCCLEPNPLWPIKVNFSKTPHEIKIDEQQSSPLLTNGFYTDIVELQKKLGTQSFADEFIYAERLMLNSDFVPRIKLPDGVNRKDVREKVETDNLVEAHEKYEEVLAKLENLREEANRHYSEDFMEFCQSQNLSGSLETNDVVMSIFKKSEVKSYFSDENKMESLKSFADSFGEMIDIKKSREEIKEEIKNKILVDVVSEIIKDDVAEVLMNEKIRTMLLSQPDNYALKAKFFDILPNINLLKRFEIKEKANKEQKNFLENLDDCIDLIKDRQKNITSELEKKNIRREIKGISRRISNVNRKIRFLKENARRFKEKREHYNNVIEKLKIRKKEIVNIKRCWQQKVLERKKTTGREIG